MNKVDQWPRSLGIPGRAAEAIPGEGGASESLLPPSDSGAGPPCRTPSERHKAIELESLRVMARILRHSGKDRAAAHRHADRLMVEVLERVGMQTLADRMRELHRLWWHS